MRSYDLLPPPRTDVTNDSPAAPQWSEIVYHVVFYRLLKNRLLWVAPRIITRRPLRKVSIHLFVSIKVLNQ